MVELKATSGFCLYVYPFPNLAWPWPSHVILNMLMSVITNKLVFF